MVGILVFLVVICLAVRVVYGLRRPHFWMVSALVALIGLPCIILLVAFGLQ